MTGYEVAIDALRKAGYAAEGAGEQVGMVDLGGALSGLADALPGSRSVQAAAGAGNTWAAQIKGWSTEAERLGQG
ncbi:MAG: hypothetical protein ACRDTF_18720, partial [Pseudonocardiaceae bacterium]